MVCPGCGAGLDPRQHGDLVFDAGVWCATCRRYHPELLKTREMAELAGWMAEICAACGEAAVPLEHDPEAAGDWRRYWRDDVCQLGEADHRRRTILLYPPGQRLASLCHELAHIFTGQDHTAEWAARHAALIAWVKRRLDLD